MINSHGRPIFMEKENQTKLIWQNEKEASSNSITFAESYFDLVTICITISS
jgi:hypothetical protein